MPTVDPLAEKMRHEEEEQRRARSLVGVEELAAQFAAKMPIHEFSPAEIQGYLLRNKRDPQAAVAGLEEWIIKTRKDKMVKTRKDSAKKLKDQAKAARQKQREDKREQHRKNKEAKAKRKRRAEKERKRQQRREKKANEEKMRLEDEQRAPLSLTPDGVSTDKTSADSQAEKPSDTLTQNVTTLGTAKLDTPATHAGSKSKAEQSVEARVQAADSDSLSSSESESEDSESEFSDSTSTNSDGDTDGHEKSKTCKSSRSSCRTPDKADQEAVAGVEKKAVADKNKTDSGMLVAGIAGKPTQLMSQMPPPSSVVQTKESWRAIPLQTKEI